MGIRAVVRVSCESTTPHIAIVFAVSRKLYDQPCLTLDVILGLVPRIYPRRAKSIGCRSLGQAQG
ncbi:hypothetical protein AGR1C_Cc40173 [Agrobacterium fabacearum TT111]|nr:hypothetical protein AGR1C_Cc40173 [Agrobacterium fabacearum TT111]